MRGQRKEQTGLKDTQDVWLASKDAEQIRFQPWGIATLLANLETRAGLPLQKVRKESQGFGGNIELSSR